MSKRLTDSRKWEDDWFLGLTNEYKLLWLYLLDKCDHAGIYKINTKLAEFCLNFTYDWEAVKQTFNGRIKVVDGDKWFLPKFLTFQYGELDPDNRIHRGILSLLKTKGIDTVSIEYGGGLKKGTSTSTSTKKRHTIGDGEFLEQLRLNSAYKHLDIDRELAKMDAWLLTRKGRQKTRRFIVNWLNKCDRVVDYKPEAPRRGSTAQELIAKYKEEA